MVTETKQCIRCQLTKDTSLFKTKKKVRKNTGLLVHEVQGICKSCHNKLYHGRYEQRNKQYIKELLVNSPCVDCNINDWRLLEFDHLPEHTKVKNISEMYYASPDTLAAEIAKCEIVCANCHRLRSYKRSKSWRLESV